MTIRVRSTGDTQPRFVKDAKATIDENGEWSATFDFSGQSVGDTFNVKASSGQVSSAKVDGSVVEEETTTPEPTTETPEPDTEEPAEDTPTTQQQTPGFGIAVAVIALLAAALLAYRRD